MGIFQLMGRNEPGLKQQSHPKLLKAPAETKEGTGLAPAATSGKKLPLQGSDKLITLQNQEKMMGKNQGYKKRLRTLRKTQLPTFLVDDPVVSQVDTWDKDAVNCCRTIPPCSVANVSSDSTTKAKTESATSSSIRIRRMRNPFSPIRPIVPVPSFVF